MLQQPPHLSRVCGHSHFKKVWLLQTQKENQSCENKSSRVAADGKHSPFSSGSPSNRTSVTGASPTGLLVRPLVACTGTYNGPSFSGRQTSLITCAESLSPPLLRLDHSYPSSRPSSPNVSSDGRKDEDAGPDLNVFKDPLRSGSLSPSSSRCGSPPALHESRCLNSDHGEDERTSVKAGNTVSSCSYSSDRDISSSHEDSLCNVASPTKRRNHTKSSQNLQLDSRSLTTDNSDASSEQIDTPAARDSSHESGGPNTNSAALSQYATPPTREKRSWLFARKTHDNGSISNVPHLTVDPVGRSKADLNEDSIATKSELSCADVNLARNSSVIRTCSLCGTTKTPLWRSGPHGPKSLCNACGIRFKKAKRSSGQSDGHEILSSPVASPGTDKAMPRPLKRKQEMLSGIEAEWNRGCSTQPPVSEATQQQQKRSVWSKAKVRNVTVSHVRDSLSHKDLARTGRDSWLTWNLQSPSMVPGVLPRSEMSRPVTPEKQVLNRVIAKDDVEAAFLLMYLSSGLIYA